MIRNFAVLGVMAAVVGLPFALRQRAPQDDWRPGDPSLTIISPHTQAIREEFAAAFAAHYRQNHGRPVKIDWLNVGGTTEISRYLTAQFQAAHGAGAGVDLFFGGGEYDHRRAFELGLTMPPWPEPTAVAAAIPVKVGGETWRTPTMFAAALSTFGICYNPDRLRDLGVPAPPAQWADLTAPRYYRQLAAADPTKSGSIAKAFEMIIQQQCAVAVARGETVGQGWEAGVRLVQLIGANARYFTDSASKVPLDVAAGDAAAGLAIDFYARAEAQVAGRNRLVFVTPRGGSSVSADPISLLRGAPHREVAVEFIEFVLSEAGQKLWCYRLGAPGGPTKYVLRRLPVRREFYEDAGLRQHGDDLQVNPFELAAEFTYRPEWTGRHFNAQRDLIRAMCLDAGEELWAAWAAIIAHGGPDRQVAAMEVLQRLPVNWESALTVTRSRERLDYLREWTEFFRANYRQAQLLAEGR